MRNKTELILAFLKTSVYGKQGGECPAIGRHRRCREQAGKCPHN
ncbi:hypothetical protein [Escherichia coli]|nr:hypothetical protein [Escherichia coli]